SAGGAVPSGAFLCRKPKAAASVLRQVLGQDSHFKHEGAVAVLVGKDDADELVTDIDLGGIIRLGAGLQLDATGIEGALQMGFDALDVGFVHSGPRQSVR